MNLITNFLTEMFAVISLLLFVSSASAWFESCDYPVELAPKTTTTITSGGLYKAYSSCRYNIKAPQGFTINADCDIQIQRDSNGNCNNEFFYVMVDGSKELLGSEFVCGYGKVNYTSKFNRLTLAHTSGTTRVGQYTCKLTLNCDCGWAVNQKIVGGRTAGVNEYISMAGLIDLSGGKSLFCGGCIITPYWVLTAAHCFTGSLLTKSNVGVLVGDHDYTIGYDSKYSKLYNVGDIVRHGAYNANTKDNDIALVRTSTEIEFNNAVGPACLPFVFARNAFDSRVPLEVPGWGTTSFAGKVSSVLQTVELITLDSQSCRNRGMSNVKDGHLCTWADKKDTCQYDSGGNLYYRYNRLYTVGIVSYGGSCASSTPSVNTKIPYYLDWIKANAYGHNICDA